MNDFNMVNVESQSQVGKSIDTIKMMNLKMDLEDYNNLLPTLKDLQSTSNKILRYFNDYLSNKERKSMSLPYNMLKKFQTLKNQFFQSSELLRMQTHIYKTSVCNRDYEKLHEQLFFKRTMKSYDEKRLWMKNYILKNQSQMQVIEEQVKKDVQYESHQFTEHRNDLNIQRLEHNYQDKLDLIKRNSTMQNINSALRNRIKEKIQQIAKSRNKTFISDNKKISNVQESQKQQQKQTNPTKLVRLPSYSCFLYFRLTKQYLRYQYFLCETNRLKAFNKRLSQYNKELKIALDKLRQKLQFQNSQASIILHKLQILSEEVIQQRRRLYKGKVTKTDYYIYLKEIQRHCNQIIQIYGFYFQYSLFQLSSNKKRSKSASKVYQMKKITDEIKAYQSNKFNSEMKKYWQENKDEILKEKNDRQNYRKAQEARNQLLLQSLTQSQYIQGSKKEQEKEKHKVSQEMILGEQSLCSPSYNVDKIKNEKIQLPQQQQKAQYYYQMQLQEEQFKQI